MARKKAVDPLVELVRQAPVRRAVNNVPLSQRFIELDDKLVAEGVPPSSDWWRRRICNWLDRYERDGVLELWGCVGRGAAKSTQIYKITCLFALYGNFNIPRGEVHYAVCLSRLKEEAAKGIQIIARWLTLLGTEFERKGDVIEISGTQKGIRVVAASVQAATGWRAYFIACDEYAKWAAGGVDMMDADEVRSSAKAMAATHPRAPVVTMSTPWGAFGSFYDTITTGTTDSVDVLGPAPTWEAAPHVTREDCQKKEPNKRRFDREYGAIFSSAATSVFTTEVVDLAIKLSRQLEIESKGETVMIIDGSRGGDRWAWALANMCWADNRERFKVLDIGGVPDATNSEKAVEWLALKATRAGVRTVFGDQFEAGAMRSMFTAHGLSFIEKTWSNKSKVAAVDRAERMFRDEIFLIPDNPELRTELLQYREKLTKSGETTYEGRRDDLVAVLLTFVMALLENQIPIAYEPVRKVKLSPAQVGAQVESRWQEQQERRIREKQEFERDFTMPISIEDMF